MPRATRDFRAGGIYHVINNGQAHSPVFESAADVERLYSTLGWATREGWIRVLCVCIMGTHVHLIVQTPDARLHHAMKRIEEAYAGYYNRTRGRPGHVFRGRYFAREIRGEIDLACTADYIDHNPVKAGMVTTALEYPHSSARVYCGSPGMSWLYRTELEQLACALARASPYRPEHYAKLWSFAGRACAREVVERALRRGLDLTNIDVLVRAGPEQVQEWLRANREREVGRSTPVLVLAGSEVLRRLPVVEASLEPQQVRLRVGLMHSVAGWTISEIAAVTRLSRSAAGRALQEHRRFLADDPEYAHRASALVTQAVRESYGDLA